MKIPPFKPRPPRWETIQQVVRIAIYTIAVLLYGEDWTDDPVLARVVPGAAYVFALIWWGAWEVTRPSSDADPAPTAAAPDPAPVVAPVEPEEGTTTTVTTTTKEPAEEPAIEPKETKP